GPPAVDAVLHHGSVIGPVARHLAIGRPLVVRGATAWQRRRGARVVDAAGEVLAFDHDVNHDLEVLVLERGELLARLGEVAGMPAELAVARVPAGGRELRAEIDERVAGKALVAHRACDVGYLLGAGERAMRLQIAERPARRHLGQTGDARVLAHDRRRVARRYDEQVEWQRRIVRREHTTLRGEIERPGGLMDEHRPTVRADEPLHRRARAVRRQMVAALADDHPVRRALSVELRPALAESEQRTVAEDERHAGVRGIELETLNRRTVAGVNRQRWRRVSEAA